MAQLRLTTCRPRWTEHALIVVQKVTRESNDTRSLQPMAEAAKVAVGEPQRMNVIADAGYSNGDRPKLARGKESFLMYPAIARSTIRATAHSSTAPPSSTRNKATRLSVRLARLRLVCCCQLLRASALPACRSVTAPLNLER